MVISRTERLIAKNVSTAELLMKEINALYLDTPLMNCTETISMNTPSFSSKQANPET